MPFKLTLMNGSEIGTIFGLLVLSCCFVGQARLKSLEYMSNLMKDSFSNSGISKKFIVCFFQEFFGKTLVKFVIEFHFKHPPYCHSKTRNSLYIWHTQKYAAWQLSMSWFGH